MKPHLVFPLLACVACAFPLASCRGFISVVKIEPYEIHLAKTDIETVVNTVWECCEKRGWEMSVRDAGVLRGVLHNGLTQETQIDIYCTDSGCTINYVSCKNVWVDEENGWIHAGYRGWLRNLERDIHAAMNRRAYEAPLQSSGNGDAVPPEQSAAEKTSPAQEGADGRFLPQKSSPQKSGNINSQE